MSNQGIFATTFETTKLRGFNFLCVGNFQGKLKRGLDTQMEIDEFRHRFSE